MNLEEQIDKISEEWEEIFISEEDKIRDNIICNYTDQDLSMGIGLRVDQNDSDEDYIIGYVNLIFEDEDGNTVDWKEAGIKNDSIFEEIADFIAEKFYDWAKNGAERGALKIPKNISDFMTFENDEVTFETHIYWNDEKVY